jgi:hypothetical protein
MKEDLGFPAFAQLLVNHFDSPLVDYQNQQRIKVIHQQLSKGWEA